MRHHTFDQECLVPDARELWADEAENKRLGLPYVEPDPDNPWYRAFQSESSPF